MWFQHIPPRIGRKLFIGKGTARVWISRSDSHKGPEQISTSGLRDNVDGGSGEDRKVRAREHKDGGDIGSGDTALLP